ncbi:MAG TPA: hypothetical protein IAC31_02585 [Candidatus Faecousia intestinigallinarum]|nr:hypothetical protein [Candidatus Faecousia intestinigallinarum]
MRKKILWKVCLVLLPAIAVSIGAVPGTVLVWSEGTPIQAFSYFDMLPEGAPQLATAFAGLMAVICTGLGVGYAVSEKPYWLKGVFWTAFASLFVAVLPYVVKTELHAVPNVLFPVIMGIECLAARMRGKEREEKAEGNRLQAR